VSLPHVWLNLNSKRSALESLQLQVLRTFAVKICHSWYCPLFFSGEQQISDLQEKMFANENVATMRLSAVNVRRSYTCTSHCVFPVIMLLLSNLYQRLYSYLRTSCHMLWTTPACLQFKVNDTKSLLQSINTSHV
jgi:hypothetical protein